MSTAALASNPLLEFVGVQAHYGAIQALKTVDVHVCAGEIVSLIGANGAGKTTCCRRSSAPRAHRQARSATVAKTSPSCPPTRLRGAASLLFRRAARFIRT